MLSPLNTNVMTNLKPVIMKRLFLLTTTIFAGMMICAISDVYAQAKSDKLKTIDIKTDNIEILNIDNLPKIKFDPGENIENMISMMFIQPFIFGDKILIDSWATLANVHKVMVYNRKGEYLNTITQSGRAQYEIPQGNLRSIWVKDDHAFIMDSKRRILEFTIDGKFVTEHMIESSSQSNSILSIQPLGDGYIANIMVQVPSSQSVCLEEFVPILARYDRNFKFVGYVGEDIIRRCARGSVNLFSYGNGINIEQYGVIYNIDSRFRITRKFRVGFDGVFQDDYDTPAKEEAAVKASMVVSDKARQFIRNVNVTKNYLSFVYRQMGKDYFVACDINHRKSKVYKIESSTPIMGIFADGDQIYFFNEGDDWTNMCIIENVGDLLK